MADTHPGADQGVVVDDQDPQGRARLGGRLVVCGGGGRVSHGVFLEVTWG